MEKQRRAETIKSLIPWVLPVGVAIAAALLYARTLAPGTVYLQDTADPVLFEQDDRRADGGQLSE